MLEICRPPHIIEREGDGEPLTAFDDGHTLSDIARWIMENRSEAEEFHRILGEMLAPTKLYLDEDGDITISERGGRETLVAVTAVHGPGGPARYPEVIQEIVSRYNSFENLQAQAGQFLDERDQQIMKKDRAYEERNRLVALLSVLYPSGVAKTAIPGWSEDWHNCVYVDFPWGQASWHYHETHAHLFAHLPEYTGRYDGHTTEQKYAKIEEFVRSTA